MNFIARHINAIGILLLTSFAAAAGVLYWNVPQRIQQVTAATQSATRYVCPMHPNVTSDKPGDCSICGMKLVVASAASSSESGCARHDSGCCTPKEGAETHAGCSHGNQTSAPAAAANPNQ